MTIKHLLFVLYAFAPLCSACDVLDNGLPSSTNQKQDMLCDLGFLFGPSRKHSQELDNTTDLIIFNSEESPKIEDIDILVSSRKYSQELDNTTDLIIFNSEESPKIEDVDILVSSRKYSQELDNTTDLIIFNSEESPNISGNANGADTTQTNTLTNTLTNPSQKKFNITITQHSDS